MRSYEIAIAKETIDSALAKKLGTKKQRVRLATFIARRRSCWDLQMELELIDYANKKAEELKKQQEQSSTQPGGPNA